MIVCDGVAKIRGNPWDPCSREKNYVVILETNLK